MIPDEFFREERTLCKKELKDALKAGEDIAGAVLETRKSIQMR